MPPAFERYFTALRRPGQPIWTRFPWYVPLEDQDGNAVIACKNKSLLRCYRYAGLDASGTAQAERGARMAQANDALKRLGGAWMVQTEAQRTRVWTLPPVAGPPLTQLVAAERARQLLEDPGSWQSQYLLTLTWTPDLLQRQRPASISLEAFVQAADDFFGHLRGILATAAPLDMAQTLTYLNTTVSDTWHPVAAPEPETRIDVMLGYTPFDAGRYPQWDARLGEWHVRLCSLTGYPGRTWADMMLRLNALSVPYRWGTRWGKIEDYLQQGILQELQRKTLSKELTPLQHAVERGFWLTRRTRNELATVQHGELSQLRIELGADLKALGDFTTVFMTWGDTAAQADGHLRQVMQTLRGIGFPIKQEGRPGELFPSHVAAWFALHPGNGVSFARRHRQTSLVAAHLWPGLQAAAAGRAWDTYLGGPPLVYAHTEGRTLFPVVLHVGDVGHYLSVGPTGSGKTTWDNLMKILWRQYHPQAQVVTFDMKKGARLVTHLLGGQWYDLGQQTLQLNPVRDIEDAGGRSDALEWLLALVADHDRTLATAGETLGYFGAALAQLAGIPRSQRTLTELSAAMAAHTRGVELRAKGERTLMDLVALHNKVRMIVQPFTQKGQLYGHIFDTGQDTLDLGQVLTFELETLLSTPTLLGPVLRHIYPRLYRRMSTDAPMLLTHDDAAIPWAVARIQQQSLDWLRLTRDKGVSMGFLTHAASDIFHSPLGEVLLGACPTRFLFPNAAALQGNNGEVYGKLGLTLEATRQLMGMTRQRQVLFCCPEQQELRPLDVPLSPLVQHCLACNSAADHRLMDQIMAEEGPEGFAPRWLAEHGFGDEAARWWPQSGMSTGSRPALAPDVIRGQALDRSPGQAAAAG